MRFLSTVAAGLALYIPSTVAEGPMGKVTSIALDLKVHGLTPLGVCVV